MTRFLRYTLFCLGLTSMQVVSAQSPSDRDIERMLRGMSVKEKVGQMTQIDLGVIGRGVPCALQHPVSLDTAKCRIAFQQYRVGSVLNVGCGSGALYRQEWATILQGIHQLNQSMNTSGIPILYGIDAIHGANYTKGATLFPQPLAQAATWNSGLVKQAHEVCAYEVRATGIPWNFSPVLDLGRQPLWSRFFETFGEDVYLAKTMSRSAIEGYQGNDIQNPFKVAACMKHFLGYSNSVSGRDRTPASMDERTLREYYLPTFEEAIAAGAHTIMINSGEINGTPVHANADILTDLLRNELQFKGVAVTDWEDVYKLVDLHRVAANRKEAVYMAVMAGIDLCMTPNDFEFADLLIELVEEGRIPEARLDLSVRRLLILKRNLGLFEQTVFPSEMYPLFGSKQHADIAYQTAAEAITLLKNENNVLPLQTNDNIVVCGNAAYSTIYLNGAWTHTWQGTDASYVNPGKLTIAEAIQAQGNNKVFVIPSSQNLNSDALDMSLFRQANKIILCLGETPSTEVPGNINDLHLSNNEYALIHRLHALGKPIILVCAFNRPRLLEPIINKVSAIVYTYWSGDEGGCALADILYGKVNPSGKLPFTYPRYANAFVHYDRKRTEDLDTDFSMKAYNPLFDFGYGLSYSNFTYSNMQISDTVLGTNGTIEVRVRVKNNSQRVGKEVVQLYYNDLVASITPSVKKLMAYEKIELKPMEEKEVRFECKVAQFSFINKELERTTEPGFIELMIHENKQRIYVQ